MPKPFKNYEGAGKKCPMVHKSEKDYDRKKERQDVQDNINSYGGNNIPKTSPKKTIERKLESDDE